MTNQNINCGFTAHFNAIQPHVSVKQYGPKCIALTIGERWSAPTITIFLNEWGQLAQLTSEIDQAVVEAIAEPGT